MDKIEVKIMNPEALQSAEDMMVFAARLTQRGHSITNMNELMKLYHQSHTQSTVRNMTALPHPTIQKFGLINIAIVGASRRFLAQITRHQNEVKFMSGSLQYSDYSERAQFVVPYEVMQYDHDHPELEGWAKQQYINSCLQSLDDYRKAVPLIGHDAAGYMMPQGMRNILIMSVGPYELKHIIQQRCCNRNTMETQYVMLRIWELLSDLQMFSNIVIPCQVGGCPEGHMGCRNPYRYGLKPSDILKSRFGLLYRKGAS